MQARVKECPLFQRVEQRGVLDSGNALIVAPTATGKSYIGRTILRRAVRRKEAGVHAYLVPYRALASEIGEAFQRELDGDGIEAVVKVATGDYNDPFYPEETDILVATYERFAGLLNAGGFRLGRLVVDEVHLLADETRGPALESLLVRLTSYRRPASLCALSATITNPESLAAWLQLPLIVGGSADRMVQVQFACEVTPDLDGKLRQLLTEVLGNGEQVVIFCRSKTASQVLARDLKLLVARYLDAGDRRALQELAFELAADDEEAQELLDLLSAGIAFHHAGLTRQARQAVETAFRNRHLKVIACTPTLAAGVNLPASLVVVRDVFRIELVRGYPRYVRLSTGELLNMLGRAGRPGQVQRGRGVALVQQDTLDADEIRDLRWALENGRGDRVTSRMGSSFDAFMRFLLAVAVDGGELTRADLAEAVKKTLWYHEQPCPIAFDRPLREDIMEDIPNYSKVTPAIRVDRVSEAPDGVVGVIVSSGRRYHFSLRLSSLDCDCPARKQWRRSEVCKHLACAIHTLLFGRGIPREMRAKALYACAHQFRGKLDAGTRIQQALELLLDWGLLERVPGGYRVTTLGAWAAGSGLDLLLIRTAGDRLRQCRVVPSIKEIASWLVTDYFSDDNKRERWLHAVQGWLDEVDAKRIRLPEKFRGDFERGLEELGQVALLYAGIAESMGMREIAQVCRAARGCLRYGVAPELVPLMALRIPRLGRARCRFLYDQRGIKSLDDLASADPSRLAGPRAPAALTRQWVETARRIQAVRRRIEEAPPRERPTHIDDFLAQFEVDQLALTYALAGTS